MQAARLEQLQREMEQLKRTSSDELDAMVTFVTSLSSDLAKQKEQGANQQEALKLEVEAAQASSRSTNQQLLAHEATIEKLRAEVCRSEGLTWGRRWGRKAFSTLWHCQVAHQGRLAAESRAKESERVLALCALQTELERAQEEAGDLRMEVDELLVIRRELSQELEALNEMHTTLVRAPSGLLNPVSSASLNDAVMHETLAALEHKLEVRLQRLGANAWWRGRQVKNAWALANSMAGVQVATSHGTRLDAELTHERRKREALVAEVCLCVCMRACACACLRLLQGRATEVHERLG